MLTNPAQLAVVVWVLLDNQILDHKEMPVEMVETVYQTILIILVLLTLAAAVVEDHTTQVDAVDQKVDAADLAAAVAAAEPDQTQVDQE